MSFDGRTVHRAVYEAEVLRRTSSSTLESYMADRVPYFYKSPAEIARSMEKGYFLSSIREILLRLPTAETFQESHFAEILAAVYGQEILGLTLLYSKLSLLTAENANAYKMDVLFCDAASHPLEFVLAEVKSSMKTAEEGLPPLHDKSCFADLFNSFNTYRQSDLEFDLATIEERMADLAADLRSRVADALLPHRDRLVRYAGLCVIDRSTRDQTEAATLATRKNDRRFDVDLLCVAELPEVVQCTYRLLDQART